MEKREIIAFCGIECTACPAYIATQTGDHDLLKRTAEKWARELGLPITPEVIVCDGCLPEIRGRLNAWCGECPIRACAIEKKHPNCGYCSGYPCDTVAKFVAEIPEAKSRLDEISAGLKP